MFTQYWSGGSSPTTVPLELQTAECSNPTGYSVGTNNCYSGGGAGVTGSLMTLLPFATGLHASAIELYYEDALLAFDPNYCNTSGTTCINQAGSGGSPLYDWLTPSLNANTQYSFYTNVGQGTCGGGTGSGDCSYAAVVQQAHGFH